MERGALRRRTVIYMSMEKAKGETPSDGVKTWLIGYSKVFLTGA